MYAWLIPEGVAEAWIVDLRLGGMHGWHTAIDRFVQERLPHYDEVHLAKGYSHPDVSGLDIARFTGVRPFDPERFDREPPHVTFVVRQDRLWYRWPLAKFLHRVFRKLGLEGSLGRLMIGDQRRMVGTVMARLRKSLPGVTFSVVGLGPSSSWASDVNDLRTERMDVEVERSWCRAYAKSQVVVGVHGSNMLLPTTDWATSYRTFRCVTPTGCNCSCTALWTSSLRRPLWRGTWSPFSRTSQHSDGTIWRTYFNGSR
jgi:hypothetical protein